MSQDGGHDRSLYRIFYVFVNICHLFDWQFDRLWTACQWPKVPEQQWLEQMAAAQEVSRGETQKSILYKKKQFVTSWITEVTLGEHFLFARSFSMWRRIQQHRSQQSACLCSWTALCVQYDPQSRNTLEKSEAARKLAWKCLKWTEFRDVSRVLSCLGLEQLHVRVSRWKNGWLQLVVDSSWLSSCEVALEYTRIISHSDAKFETGPYASILRCSDASAKDETSGGQSFQSRALLKFSRRSPWPLSRPTLAICGMRGTWQSAQSPACVQHSIRTLAYYNLKSGSTVQSSS